MTLGVIGGLGPETGCRFCLDVNNIIKKKKSIQPHILLDNIPVSKEAERSMICGGAGDEHLQLLFASIDRLNKLGAGVIAIPCNTVHAFIDEIRERSACHVISIIEETSKACKGFRKVGLLASQKTIGERLYQKALEDAGISIITPDKDAQVKVDECILHLINDAILGDDAQALEKIIADLEDEGAQAIIIGCTDLPVILEKLKISIPLISSTKVLELAAADAMLAS